MQDKTINGKRVKLIQGTPKTRNSKERHNVSMWCAGDIPEGAIGTVAPVYVDKWNIPIAEDQGCGFSDSYMQILWDEHQPKDGYFFAVTTLNDFEVI
jgi:hypothetical protein